MLCYKRKKKQKEHKRFTLFSNNKARYLRQ